MANMDYFSQLMSGVLPQRQDANLPYLGPAKPDGTFAPTPAAQPSMLGRALSGANSVAGTVGGMMTPDVIKALALAGKLGTDMGGRGKPANAISDLAVNLASGPTASRVAGATPATQPQAAQGDPRDLNKDGVVSPDELKISMTGTGSGAVSQLKDLFKGAVNPPSGAEGNVGTSAPATVASNTPTSVQNLNRDYEKEAMWLSGLTGNPGFTAELIKNKMAHDVNSQKAIANQMSAQASLSNAAIAAKRLGWEMSDDYVQRQGAIEQAKKFGDKAAEMAYRNQVITMAKGTPVTDPELKRYGSNLGEVMTALGTTDLSTIVNSIRAADARIEAAKIMASGGIKSAAIQSAGVERAAITGLLTNNEAELRRIGDVQLPLPKESPNYAMQQLLAMQGKVRFGTPEDVKRKEELVTEGNIYRQRLADLGGVDSTPSPRRERNATPNTKVYKTKADVQADVNKGILKDGDTYTIDGKTYQIKLRSK